MEKRFLSATFISFLILVLWSVVVPRPTKDYPNLKHSQLYENKNVIENNNLSHQPPSPVSQPFVDIVEEHIETIETNKLAIDFSNIGGTISKVKLKEYSVFLPVRGMGTIIGFEKSDFKVEPSGESSITYKRDDDGLTILRTYQISPDNYNINIITEIINKTDMSKQIKLDTLGLLLDMSSLDINKHPYTTDRGMFEYVLSTTNGIYRKNNAFKFALSENKEVKEGISWLGFRDRYFCIIFKPEHKFFGYLINPINEKELRINLLSPQLDIDPGAIIVLKDVVFAGPENVELLKPYKFGFEDIKRYYRLTLFDVTAKIVYASLSGVHKVVGNWGVAILLLGILIYFVTYPLTLRSMTSMRETQQKMQLLQPKIENVRQKYRDNPHQMNIEMMELYKKHNVNPISLGGCLPMLLQMPVFFGLTQVLLRTASFKGADFLWIKDLSEPDRLFILPISLPFLGNEFNILPIITAIVMFFQQKLNSSTMVVTDPVQIQQQKMMLIIMPIIIGCAFYKFASGWTLYFTIFYALSAITQLKISKKQISLQEK